MKNVVMIGGFPKNGSVTNGPSIVAQNLFSRLSKHFDIDYYILQGRSHGSIKDGDYKDVHFINTWQLIKMLFTKKIDLLHITTFIARSFFFILIAKKLRGFPILFTSHGSQKLECEQGMSKGFRRIYNPIVDKMIIKTAEQTVCVSELLKNKHAEYYGIRVDGMRVVGNGVNPIELEPSPHNSVKSKEILVTVGTTRAKGLETAIESLLDINRKDAVLYIVGKENEYTAALRKKYCMSRHHNDSQIIFTGLIPDEEKNDLLKHASIYLQTSTWESFSIATLEAARFGIPVIISKTVGVSSIFTDGVDGFVIDAGDKVRLGELINKLLNSQELRTRIGNAGRELAKKQSWDAIAEKYRAIYDEMLSRAKSRK